MAAAVIETERAKVALHKHNVEVKMIHSDQNLILVTFVNLFERRQMAQIALPALPSAGDVIYLQGHGYEVINREWTVQESGQANIVIVVQPQINEHGERPFSYADEES